ncbi:MAG: 16S rRNA (cytosine(1402)-N(4))-methyltransferase RsmH [Lepagella sp.]
MESEVYHIPALLQESVSGLEIKPDGIYVDVTFGGGGHSRAILEHLGVKGHLYGFDRDMDAYANAPDDPRFTFVHSDFRFITNFMQYYGVEQVDGIIADLGVSFHHFDDPERGFSFRADAPLDMRMNQSGGKTAADILATYSREELERIFHKYTDLKRINWIVSNIVKARDEEPILTTGRLVEVVKRHISPKSEKKDLAQVFQALRIEVNDEMQSLRYLLEQAVRVLRTGGKLAVITYHSIEDRMVKNIIKSGNVNGEIIQDLFGRFDTPWKAINRSPIVPTAAEIEANPRSRSAKLRIAEKIQNKTTRIIKPVIG